MNAIQFAQETASRIENMLNDADSHGILTERTRAAARVFVKLDIEQVFADAKRVYESNRRTIACCAAKKGKKRGV